ncbi:MAG: hypothetical protein ACE5GL_05685 [Calditrichia bacterium]
MALRRKLIRLRDDTTALGNLTSRFSKLNDCIRNLLAKGSGGELITTMILLAAIAAVIGIFAI